MFWNRQGHEVQATVAQAGTHHRATLLFGVLLLLFVQTLTLFFDSIYKIALTKLSVGKELLGVLFLLSPLLVFLLPQKTHRKVLRGSVALFLAARAVVPLVGAAQAVVITGLGVGAFLVAFCFVLSRPFRALQGDAGIALGIALLLSIALRAWGATYDFTLAASGAWLGWVLIGIAVWLLWSVCSALHESGGDRDGPLSLSLSPSEGERVPKAGEGLIAGPEAQRAAREATHQEVSKGQPSWPAAFGPALSLFANLTVVYLVLSSPGVVEAWMGFDNTYGAVLLIVALGCALVLMLERGRIPFGVTRSVLVVWNLAFALALVGGILALRIDFPATPEAAPVIVRPQNVTARLLLNLMFLLSPVVLFNVQAACRSLKETVNGRVLGVPVFLGVTLLTLTTTVCIFTNTWGYVGSISAVFRNQFHLPFAVIACIMTATLLLPGWRAAFAETECLPPCTALARLAGALALIAAAGTWHYRPVASKAVPDRNRLTILTYNLQQGAALNGDRNWENQLALFKTIGADIIGLQESDTPRPSNGNVSAAKYFGAKLGYHIYYGPNTVAGTYGTAILSRFPLHNQRTFFTFSDEDEVGTALAELDIQGRKVAFFNSHPSGRIPRRCHALELVRRAAPYEYAIAVGDFNSSPREQAYQIIAARLKDSWLEKYPDSVGRLHSSLHPHGTPSGWHDSSSGQVSASGDTIAIPDRIDHIFVSKPFRVVESYFLPAPDSQTDHPAHWSVVIWE
jgi:endonuclease/exonuclease/phosphatase family metal-dependent hydrolase